MATQIRFGLALLLAGGLSACGGEHGASNPDAAVDAAPDSPGGCPAARVITGEYLDLNATDVEATAIFNAAWEILPGGDADTTSPNGRVELCAPSDDPVAMAVTGPAPYLSADVFLARWSDEAAMAPFSLRGLSAAQASALLEAHGEVPDETTGTLFVLQTGEAQTLQVDDANALAFSHDGTAWTPGASGVAVLFLRVAPGSRQLFASGATLQGRVQVTVAANRHVMTRVRAQP